LNTRNSIEGHKHRSNSFDFVRFVAALGVLISHHFPLAGYSEPRFLGISIGFICVEIFFLMSGYLICKSIINNPSFSRFVAARVLRILPNLVFALTFTSLVTMVVFQNYSHWFGHLRYIAQNIIMLVRGGPYYEIAGVFESLPEHAINGSIWSLPSEVWCYFILYFVLVALPGRRAPLLIVLSGLCALAWLKGSFALFGIEFGIGKFGMLGLAFFVGATCASLSWKLPVLSSPKMAWFSKGGDASYGMYIFAWPVQQFCVMWVRDFWTSMALAAAITIAIGYFTWHSFEKRALGQVDRLANYFSGLYLAKT
jgi:peptidoglycan/LPS O-acetylase OafA/YrhL